MNKDVKELILFVAYFIFVIFFPVLYVPALKAAFYYSSPDLFGWLAVGITTTICLLAEFKIQFLMILIPVLKIRKTTKNPLLLRLFRDIKLNNKILAIGFSFDLLVLASIFIISMQTKHEDDVFHFFIIYLIYFSFTINYIVIYLSAFTQSLSISQNKE